MTRAFREHEAAIFRHRSAAACAAVFTGIVTPYWASKRNQ